MLSSLRPMLNPLLTSPLRSTTHSQFLESYQNSLSWQMNFRTEERGLYPQPKNTSASLWNVNVRRRSVSKASLHYLECHRGSCKFRIKFLWSWRTLPPWIQDLTGEESLDPSCSWLRSKATSWHGNLRSKATSCNFLRLRTCTISSTNLARDLSDSWS